MSKPSKRRSSLADLFRERELKLDADGADQLEQVRRYLISHPHYRTPGDLKAATPPAMAQDMAVLGKPDEIYTPLRLRVYYDDAALRGFSSGVEIRIEARNDGRHPFKQVIKMGNNVAGDDGTFCRDEYSAPLKSAAPDLSVLGAAEKKALKAIYGVCKLDAVALRPLVMMASQRWRYEYHPDGDPATRIEYAHDVARGETFTGYRWDLYQAEIEMKAGDPACLAGEERRLRAAFNFFRAAHRSKPSPGFDVLAGQLSAPGARAFVDRVLEPGRFHVYGPPPFGA